MKPLFAIAMMTGLAACQPMAANERAAVASSAMDTTTPPDARIGSQEPDNVLDFAQAACGGCHAVEQPFLSPNPQAPAFADIANRKGLSAETLSTWLQDAHNYPEDMDFDLDDPRASDLTAYILTLRDVHYQPPN